MLRPHRAALGARLKHGVDVGAGVVDADYRGNVGVILFNLSDTDLSIGVGDRVAQLILERIHAEVREVDSLDATVRVRAASAAPGSMREPRGERAQLHLHADRPFERSEVGQTRSVAVLDSFSSSSLPLLFFLLFTRAPDQTPCAREHHGRGTTGTHTPHGARSRVFQPMLQSLPDDLVWHLFASNALLDQDSACACAETCRTWMDVFLDTRGSRAGPTTHLPTWPAHAQRQKRRRHGASDDADSAVGSGAGATQAPSQQPWHASVLRRYLTARWSAAFLFRASRLACNADETERRGVDGKRIALVDRYLARAHVHAPHQWAAAVACFHLLDGCVDAWFQGVGPPAPPAHRQPALCRAWAERLRPRLVAVLERCLVLLAAWDGSHNSAASPRTFVCTVALAIATTDEQCKLHPRVRTNQAPQLLHRTVVAATAAWRVVETVQEERRRQLVQRQRRVRRRQPRLSATGTGAEAEARVAAREEQTAREMEQEERMGLGEALWAIGQLLCEHFRGTLGDGLAVYEEQRHYPLSLSGHASLVAALAHSGGSTRRRRPSRARGSGCSSRRAT